MDFPVVLFDGVCNLCSGTVTYLIRHDKTRSLRFASLQSEAASRLLKEHQWEKNHMASFILIEEGRVFEKSTAALRLAKYLPWYWKWTGIFLWLPARFRDAVYNFIASKRYRWFGKKDECMIPTPELRSRFLE